jgi:uncharacterized protein (DUF1778 family)
MPNEPTARLEARLPVHVHATLKRAAQIQGRTLTDFVIGAAHEAAIKAIEEVEIIRISAEDQKRFAEALLNPREPNAALRRAFEHHRRLVGTE